MSDAVISKAVIELELKQNDVNRKLDDVERKTERTAKQVEGNMNGAFGGVAKTMLNIVAAAGTAEAAFRATGAAVAIANGDMEAAESALRAIPGGVGAAAGALIDLKRIIDQDTEAAIRFKEAMLDMGRTAGDTSGVESLQKFLEQINQQIAKLEGREGNALTLRMFDQRRDIDVQIQAFENLRQHLETFVQESEKANIRLQRIDMANSVAALRDGEIGRGAAGLLGSATFSFGQVDRMTEYNALIDSLREAGITAETSEQAIAQLEQRMAGLGEKSEELVNAVQRLQNLREEQEQAEQREHSLQQREQSFDRETAMEESLHRRLELLREEDDLERRRIAIRHQLEDRLRETSSNQIRRMIREEADLRLKAIDEEALRRREAEMDRAMRTGAARQFEQGLNAQGFSAEEFRRLLPGGPGGQRQEVEAPKLQDVVEQVRDTLVRAVNTSRGAVFSR